MKRKKPNRILEQQSLFDSNSVEADVHVIYGAPGTGKTTKLVKIIEELINSGRYEPSNIGICSLTKAAAVEIVNRVKAISKSKRIPSKNIGTLHSLCFSKIDSDGVILNKENIEKFNNWLIENGNDVYCVSSAVYDKRNQGSTFGDSLYEKYSLYRTSSEINSNAVEPEVVEFLKLWETFKEENNLIDFHDMISKAFKNIDKPFEACKVLICDEVQDFSEVEIQLIKKFASSVDLLVLALDDDQTIYCHRGADSSLVSKYFKTPKETILPITYRLPKEILDFSLDIIRQIKERKDKHVVSQNPIKGSVEFIYPSPVNKGTQFQCYSIIHDIIKENKTIMVLATCNYMLIPFAEFLKTKGLAFHNPWQPDSLNFNSLKYSGVAKKLKNYLEFRDSLLNEEEVKLNIIKNFLSLIEPKEIVKSESLVKLEQLISDDYEGEYVLDKNFLREFFIPGVEERIKDDVSFKYLIRQAKSKYSNALNYCIRVYSEHGIEHLNNPKCILGTVHSVKGGEADVVMFSPDISPAMQKSEKNMLTRLAYVAITRARERVILTSPINSNFIKV